MTTGRINQVAALVLRASLAAADARAPPGRGRRAAAGTGRLLLLLPSPRRDLLSRFSRGRRRQLPVDRHLALRSAARAGRPRREILAAHFCVRRPAGRMNRAGLSGLVGLVLRSGASERHSLSGPRSPQAGRRVPRHAGRAPIPSRGSGSSTADGQSCCQCQEGVRRANRLQDVPGTEHRAARCHGAVSHGRLGWQSMGRSCPGLPPPGGTGESRARLPRRGSRGLVGQKLHLCVSGAPCPVRPPATGCTARVGKDRRLTSAACRVRPESAPGRRQGRRSSDGVAGVTSPRLVFRFPPGPVRDPGVLCDEHPPTCIGMTNCVWVRMRCQKIARG